MKRLLKSWVFWAFVLAPTAALIVHLMEWSYDQDVCSRCQSSRWRGYWRMGEDSVGYLSVWRGPETVAESHVYVDGWADAHAHDWRLRLARLETPYSWAGQPGVLGRYEGDAAFRAFMLAKRRAGEARREDFLAALDIFSERCGPKPQSTQLARERAAGWVDEFVSAPSSAAKRPREGRTPP